MKLARELKMVLDATVEALQNEDLPDHVPVTPTEKVKNLFD